MDKINNLTNKFSTKTYSITTGSTIYNQLYIGTMDLSSEIQTYGTPIATLIRNSTSNGGVSAVFTNNTTLRAWGIVASASIAI